MMPPDTSRTIEIQGSPLTLLAITAAVCIPFIALGAVMASGHLDGKDPDITARLTGWLCMVTFGLVAAIGIRRALVSFGPVVTIAPQGFRDLRVSPDFVPWRAVRGISTWGYSGQKVMVIAVDPAVEKTLKLDSVTRWTRSANALLGADGLCFGAAGLKIDYDTLLSTSIAYARAHGGQA
jgi:hypothetical protein